MKKEVIKQGGVVPHLRFPEFKEEWVEKKLGDVLKYFKGYAFKSEIFVKEGIRVIRVSDLGRMSIRHDNEQIFVDVKEKEKYTNYQVSRKDIIITTVGSKPNLVESAVGRAIFIKDDLQALLNQNLLILRPINNKVTDPFFVYSQFSDKNYTNYIDIIQRGNANQSVNSSYKCNSCYFV
ncbi:hypothetical protein HMPREF9714_01696 [Myroides odoratimimus CCUG 12901]|uniref:restriction endonuclease subunit S n=1 Tax=Myroides odoratimimus TaxID=76832 RepID=UPI00024616F9|nr:restriction endonuclease subunit S [Myroides odoratimimus]EHO10011.1 hypothetical protein HMPREF9714_01696 [Myroides odoratimimus CCUG 12901]